MARSKRTILRQAVSKPRHSRSEKDLQHLSKSLLSRAPRTSLPKALFVMEPDDLQWLDSVVATLKSTRRRTNKSEMIKLGVALMRQKTLDELRELLRQLD